MGVFIAFVFYGLAVILWERMEKILSTAVNRWPVLDSIYLKLLAGTGSRLFLLQFIFITAWLIIPALSKGTLPLSLQERLEMIGITK